MDAPNSPDPPSSPDAIATHRPGYDAAASDVAAYRTLVAELYAADRPGVHSRPGPVRAALAKLGHPERRMAALVHVGGTNGKGSTATFIDAIVRACGRRSGLYCSPHLHEYTERMRIQGASISPAALCAVHDRIAPVLDGLTFLERTTVLALQSFADAGVDIAVIEVGIGGRLDATNAIDAHVACITGVALDHCDRLGCTVPAIAREKAGIFRAGQRIVLGRAGDPEARNTLLAQAAEAGAAAVTAIDAPVPTDVPLGLTGAHQRDNAAAALAVAEHLATLGHLPADRQRWQKALATAHIAGRLETVSTAPTVVLDGAHNPDGARAIARHLQESWPRPRIAVLAVCHDKDVAGIINALVGAIDYWIATEADTPRALAAEDLGASLRAAVDAMGHGCPVAIEKNPEHAFAQAQTTARERGGQVLIVGSLYLIGAARRHFLGADHSTRRTVATSS